MIDLAATRDALLADLAGSAGGILFELVQEGRPAFKPVAATGVRLPDGPCEIAADSLLPRWLRVNATFLPVPDRIGVFEALCPPEQGVLQALGVGVCVPLIHDGGLEAWIGVRGLSERNAAEAWPRSAGWAGRLHAARADATARRHAESVSRSNRLSVTGQLAASIAHEIRNPLAAIRSTVQMIRDGDASPSDHPPLLGAVLQEVDRVSTVLTQMLTWGRPHAATHGPCELDAIVADAVAFCAPYAKRSGQQFARTGGGPLWTLSDPHELRQVFVNVLLNACQASEPRTSIAVATSTERDATGAHWAVVHVVDHGTGIAPGDLPRVFDAFFTTKRDGGGLGLAICRDTVARFAGRIDIDSQLGTGTDVTIRLPLEHAHGSDPHR